MPYIKQNERPVMNVVVEKMKTQGVKPDGKLNYVLYKFFQDTVGKELSYNNIKNYLAELNECAEEIRRRYLSYYENEKIQENGDVI
jgi:hypothetical protein